MYGVVNSNVSYAHGEAYSERQPLPPPPPPPLPWPVPPPSCLLAWTSPCCMPQTTHGEATRQSPLCRKNRIVALPPVRCVSMV